ncbi:MAG: TonB-dependent receptor [candidate division Zixibacteria bacterium]|nr:TonB-dependent receptor [candidate division Zixibacteria bacterium]
MHGMIVIVLAFMSVFVGSVAAHNENISGKVTDNNTGEAIPYATVQIEGTSLGIFTDTNGCFEMRHLPSGGHTLIVSMVGYSTRKHKFDTEVGSASLLEIKLEPIRIDAGSIVVTGTRTPRFVKDVPVFTEVVSRSSIENKSAVNIYEALEGEAGVRVEQQCQACNFSILRMQGLGADHTQVLLDGQPVYTGLASVYGLQQFSTADVDHIEIVKGAGSALYGSSAVAGAINIISSIPRATEGIANIEFGEHGTNRYRASAGTRKDKLGIFLFAQQSEQDELDETGDINAAGGVDEPDGWLDRVRASSRNAGLNLFLDDIFFADRLIFRGRLLNENRLGGWADSFENPFAPGTERIITDRYSGQLEYRVWLSGGTELHSSLSYIEHKRDATNDTFLGDYEEANGEMPPVDLLRPYTADEQLLVATVDVVQPMADRHRLLAGLQFTHNNLEESGMYLDGDPREPYKSVSNKKANEVGIYAQDEFKVSDKIELVGGIRFDYHESEDEFRGSGDVLPQGLEPLEYDESSVNPRFTVKYSVSEKLVLRGSIGTGFRVPYGFSEDLHLCSGSPRVYKGGDLSPEKSLSYSVTADYTTASFTASVNLYRTELDDAIAFVEADENIVEFGYSYQWRNIDNAYVTGAELNASLALTKNLTMAIRAELFEGKYDHHREDWLDTPYEEMSRNISRYPQFSGGVKLDFSPSDWNFVIDADYKGKMYIDLTEPADPAEIKIHETESFVIVNAKLSKTVFERYQVYVGARNLTDYTQEEKHIDDAAFLYAPVYGRILYGGIQVSF